MYGYVSAENVKKFRSYNSIHLKFAFHYHFIFPLHSIPPSFIIFLLLCCFRSPDIIFPAVGFLCQYLILVSLQVVVLEYWAIFNWSYNNYFPVHIIMFKLIYLTSLLTIMATLNFALLSFFLLSHPWIVLFIIPISLLFFFVSLVIKKSKFAFLTSSDISNVFVFSFSMFHAPMTRISLFTSSFHEFGCLLDLESRKVPSPVSDGAHS